MRVGVIGLLPREIEGITAETVGAIGSLGFSGVAITLADPRGARRADLMRVRDTLHDRGLWVAQVVPRHEVLVHPEEERRAQGIRSLQAACTCAQWLDAAAVYVRPGSLNPAGPWTPHPDNTRLKTLNRLVDSLRQSAQAAEDVGIPLALEGGAVSPLDTPERARDILESVDSPGLRFNADPVNFVRSLDDLYNTTSLIHRLFDLCGPYVVSAHAKDISVDDSVTVRLRECLLGDGYCDQTAFLQRFAQTCPDGFVLIEHLPDDQIPVAKANLDRVLASAGLHWRDGGRP